MVVFSEVLLSRCLHYFVSLLDVLEELTLADSFFGIEKCAASYLVQTIPLSRVFRQASFNKFPELRTIRNVLEYFPEVLFDGRRKPFVIGIRLDSPSERWRFHSNHKQSGPQWENICLLPMVFGINRQAPQLAINLSIVKNFFLVLLLFQFLLNFVEVDLIVPELRCVINFWANVVSHFDNRVILLLQNIVAILFLHTCSKAEIRDY